jgi:hypothetical protein
MKLIAQLSASCTWTGTPADLFLFSAALTTENRDKSRLA